MKDGWSDAKSPEAWQELYDKKREAKRELPDTMSPTRAALGKLQDGGLSQKMPDLAEVALVGKDE